MGDCTPGFWPVDVVWWSYSPGDRPAPAVVVAAGDYGDNGSRPPSDPFGNARCLTSGYLDRLCHSCLLYRWPGHAILLAWNSDVLMLSHRLPLDSADGVHADLAGSVAKPLANDLARACHRLSLLGGGSPHDTLSDAGGAARGLYPYGPRQRLVAEPHRQTSRAKKRHAAGPPGDWVGIRVSHRGLGGDRSSVQSEWARAIVRAVHCPP